MKIVLDEEALGDLAGIYAWIARDNPSAADAMIGLIVDEIESLGRLPHLGHAGTAQGTLEWVVTASPHIIVYEIDDGRGELVVIGVFRSSQQNRRS